MYKLIKKTVIKNDTIEVGNFITIFSNLKTQERRKYQKFF